MVYLIALIIAALGFGAAGITVNQTNSKLQELDTLSNASCYNIESNVTKTITEENVVADCTSSGVYQVSDKNYVRLRQQIAITNAKIAEGNSYAGSCGPSGVSRLRNIAKSAGNVGKVGDIYWEDVNHLGDDLSEFILILTEKTDTDHVFDVYINSDLSNDLPEFVTNCKETGGLIPVTEGAATKTFPPQSISTSMPDFNQQANQVFSKSCCVADFNKANDSGYLKDYFIRIQEADLPQGATKIGIFTKTVEENSRIYNTYYHTGTLYLQDNTESSPDKGKVWIYNASNAKPPTSANWHNFSLQLTNVKFITTSEWTWATPECKPAIYLYPETKQAVSVKVLPKGRITESIPYYPHDGWFVTAEPSGTISSFGNTYPYLYYETELDAIPVPSEGWIRSSEDLPEFFNETLPGLGLNRKEQNDFNEYWIPLLSDLSDMWQIGLMDTSILNRLETLLIRPEPETLIRVRFYFKPIDQNDSIPILNKPSIHNVSERKGFTVVDWGGILDGASCTTGYISK